MGRPKRYTRKVRRGGKKTRESRKVGRGGFMHTNPIYRHGRQLRIRIPVNKNNNGHVWPVGDGNSFWYNKKKNHIPYKKPKTPPPHEKLPGYDLI